jgi:hypothetical protein
MWWIWSLISKLLLVWCQIQWKREFDCFDVMFFLFLVVGNKCRMQFTCFFMMFLAFLATSIWCKRERSLIIYVVDYRFDNLVILVIYIIYFYIFRTLLNILVIFFWSIWDFHSHNPYLRFIVRSWYMMEFSIHS